jgi:TrmH family RNA methyltransferase
MLSKNKIKLIKSLDNKKQRNESGLFLVEGNKLVSDILPFFECELLVAKPSWIAVQGDLNVKELIAVEDDEIKKASLLKNPQDVIAVFVQRKVSFDKEMLCHGLSLLLDGIQDPGNLGTIIRIADWFGIKNVVCSPDTSDIYNPKTIQATMGGIAHVNIFYEPLAELLQEWTELSVYGTFLEGKNIYCEKLNSSGLIVMGNEGNGISPSLEKYITHRLHIPSFPSETLPTKSLNVAVATAVTCAEFRRQQMYGLPEV